MIRNVSRVPRRALGIAFATCALVAALPATAPAAGTTTQDILGVKVPASVHVKSTASTTKPATTASTPATGTPASSTPASTGTGAQPGTVAPGSTTAGTATAPATVSTPAATTPASTGAGTPATGIPAGTTRTGTTTVLAIGKTKSKKSKGLSTAALMLAILGALLVLGALAWAVARLLALEPRWTTSLMYSLREANYRASATWSEFSDWVRLGR